MRIALVDYLNAAPLWWGLKAGLCPEDWDLCFEPPARCAEMLRSGEAQAGIIPSLEFDRIHGLCMPVPLGVACSGDVRSVLLFSGGAISGLRRVLLDPASRTSQGLLKILLRSRIPEAPSYLEERWDGDPLAGDTAALVIGDRALRLRERWNEGEVTDLGGVWCEETGLPFVFALWAARRTSNEQAVAEVLLKSYIYGAERLEEIVARYAPRVALPDSEVRDYLTINLHYPLREPDYEGLREFWALASLEADPAGDVAP